MVKFGFSTLFIVALLCSETVASSVAHLDHSWASRSGMTFSPAESVISPGFKEHHVVTGMPALLQSRWPDQFRWLAQAATASSGKASPGETAGTSAEKKETASKPDAAKENQPAGLKKKGDDAGKKEGEAEAEKGKEKSETPSVITRPLKAEEPADPQELEITPDAQGKVRFSFSRQPWPAILEWLARVSHLSLDWQELPADYLNLQTQRDYTLEEARDLINHHLLARGFTMLKSGEMLTVVNVSKLNAAMVPRVEPEELHSRLASEFVKVSFPLKWILAEKAVEELKPMLSSNGKLTALKELNRIEALDTARNLQDIYELLQQTQTEDVSTTTLVREFRLEHRRAADVVLLVEAILGLDNKRMPMNMGRGGDMMNFQIMNQLQQMQQMLQQGHRGGQGNSNDPKAPPEPRLIVNDQENSILAHATPDKLEIIAQTIKAIDVPGDAGNQLLHSINRVKPYRLSTADPQPIMALLKEMGNLSPQSRLQVDEKSKSLILYGTLADHFTTQALIERLDGTNRKFEVVSLRRLRADAVAGTIQYLLGAEDEEKSQNNNRRGYYYGYQPYGSSNNNKEDRPFKVDADIINNRLLIWANDVELEEVRNLLVKMGETPPGKSNPDTMRTLDLPADQDADRLLERIKQLWPDLENNPIQIQTMPASPASHPAVSPVPQTLLNPASPDPDAEATAAKAQAKTFMGAKTSSGPAAHSPSVPVRLTWWQKTSAAAPATIDPAAIPQNTGLPEAHPLANRYSPVIIQQLPDGRLIYRSEDTKALDRLEDLINELSPPAKDYHIFQLKYPTTWAYGIELILEDFFEDKSLQESTFDPWWGTTQTTRVNRSSRLSRQKELKVISNDDSHTILVQGATLEQLKVIGELIDVYDRPTSSDPQALRKTEIFQLQYSNAPAIAEAVKQVYRDLLSANDPALQNPNQQKPSEEPKFTYIYGRQNSGDDKDENPGQPIKFKGLLSVGVDEISNTVIVSSTEGLMRDIRQLILQLDQAARPTHTVQVLQVKNISPNVIQQRLKSAFSSPAIHSSETGRYKRNAENGTKDGSPSNPNARQGSSNGRNDPNGGS